jgi:uncharacterized protein (DUF305 family)
MGWTRSVVWLVVAGLVVTAIGGYVVGRASDEANAPGEGSVEAGFARDMSAHHSQAVAMAETIRTRTDDEFLALFAADVALTQQSQIGQMRGWLDHWELPPSSLDPPMAWAGHTTTTMPGMATPAEFAELRSLPVPDAEVVFLQLMAAHHRGGIEMANAALALPVQPQVARLAEAIVTSQTSELDAINGFLRDRGGQLEPLPATGSETDDTMHGG